MADRRPDDSAVSAATAPAGQRDDMNIVIVGHVDHGKSTIIGRLLADTHSLPQGKLEQVREMCRRTSKPFEYAFLLDALKDEQAQGITIDASRCFFQTEKRSCIIIDAPGHVEFLKNMITGAARAEAALLVIDAQEGVQENSRRHGYMLSLLGIRQIVVLVNKMDLVDYDETVYRRIVSEYSEFLSRIGLEPAGFLPVSGREGDNVASASQRTPWYAGPTVLQALDAFSVEPVPEDKPFRMPVQGVYKFTADGDKRRIIAGTVLAGCLQVGDAVVFHPSGKRSRVASLERFNAPSMQAVGPGCAAGFTLEDQIYVRRGELAVRADERQPQTASRLRASVFWLGRRPLEPGREYSLKIGSAKIAVQLESVERVLDASTLAGTAKEVVERHDVAECVLKLSRPAAFDCTSDAAETSRFVLVDEYEIAGGGIMREALGAMARRSTNVQWQPGKVTRQQREAVLGQTPKVVWLTGLSGSGKSTIAVEVERQLAQAGRFVYRLDGDNVRHGLNADLGFSEAERTENIRRIAEVAKLFHDAGLTTIVSFISPLEEIRQLAKTIVGPEHFQEVYVRADLETCIERDPKGLYAKALAGQLADFTGVSSPYEEPANPDLVLDTTKSDVETCVKHVINLVEGVGSV